MAQRIKHLPAMWETQVQSLIRKIPPEKGMATTLVSLPREFHGQRSLAGYSPWGCKESDTTEQLNCSFFHLGKLLRILLRTLSSTGLASSRHEKHTHLDPDTNEGRAILVVPFISQSTPDTRQKLQKLEQGPQTSSPVSLDKAFKVFNNREDISRSRREQRGGEKF